MGTSATGGTGSGGWSQGTFFWLALDLELHRFDRYTRLAQDGQNVTTRRMAKTGLNGGLVVACYGRWDHSGLTLTTRNGGHCITPVRVDTTGTLQSELRYRDPASGGASETTQSTFATTTMNMVDQVYIAYGVPMILSTMDIQPAPSDGRLRIIDKYYTIFPKQGLTDLPGINPKLLLTTPQPLNPDAATQTLVDVIGGEVKGVAQAPSRNFWAYVAAGLPAQAPGVYHVDPLTGVVTNVGGLGVAKGCTFGRDERLYALDRNVIKCYKPDDDDMLMFEQEIPIPLPHTNPGGIAFDDLTDEIVVISLGESAILRFQNGLLLPAVQTMSGIPLNDFKCMQVHPGTGPTWVLCDGSVRELMPDPNAPTRLLPGQTYTPPAGVDLRSFSFDSDGHLFVNLGGTLTELASSAAAGFQPVPGSPFNGVPAGSCLAMSLSRTNFDPMIHSDPGWNTDIPADEAAEGEGVPDCLADWNASDDVDVFDLLAYLDDWFAGSVEAELDGSAGVDVFDLLSYLDLWFVGC
jgi:hypothetical protein